MDDWHGSHGQGEQPPWRSLNTVDVAPGILLGLLRVSRAYWRSDLLARRREMMAIWPALYCSEVSNVVTMVGR